MGRFAETFGMMVLVASGIAAAAGIGLFGLWWITLRPFFKFLFG